MRHILVSLLAAPITAVLFPAVATASLYQTECRDLEGTVVSVPAGTVDNVVVEAMPTPSPTADIDRREQIEISDGLATALGIDPADVGTSGPAPQVRVTLLGFNPITGFVPTANFSVASIDPAEPGLRLRVWLPDDLTPGGTFNDDDNGFFKLFNAQDPAVVFSTVQAATVFSLAPNRTVEVSPGQVTELEYFLEPNPGNKYFHECVQLGPTNELAVLVPHGGGIETGISAEMPTLLGGLEIVGLEPSVWEAIGQWGSGETFERWHITSTQISEDAFPGYAQLANSGIYGYAVSLHGFSETDAAVILGGRTSRQDKCFLVASIEHSLELVGLAEEITYKIFGPDGVPVDIVRASDGPGDNPQPLSGVDHLDGDSPDNIVNRLSPNTFGGRGFGGIQLELAGGLRNDAALFAAFMNSLALGLDRLIDLTPRKNFCALYE